MTETPPQAAPADTHPAPANRPKKRSRLRLPLLLLALLAILFGGLLFAIRVTPAGGIGGYVDAAMRTAQGFVTGSRAPSSSPANSTPAASGGVPGGAAPGTAELEVRVADLSARLDAALDGVSAQAEVAREVRSLSAEIAAQRTELDALANEIAASRDIASAARRAAEGARDRVEATMSASGSEADALQSDIGALYSSLEALRGRQDRLAARVDAVAGDLHLAVRYGGDSSPAPAARAAAVERSAPGYSLYSPPGSAAPTAAPPPDLVQGRYRVGDWLGGYGVISAIRKTQEGDHLVTPSGVVFAPAPKAMASE
ncbi:MAG: hypothetical protein OYG32_04885 [Rhodospirillaceae bacterium]|nr:hypothetical protein [Rhodospirillaceae bacterium]